MANDIEGKRDGGRTRAISRTSSERCDSNSDLGLVVVEAKADIFEFSLPFCFLFGLFLYVDSSLDCVMMLLL
jgi:hypothetical protein